MSEFYGTLKMDFRRAFLSPSFFIAIVLMTFNLFFGILDELRLAAPSDVLYYYYLATFQNLNIELLLCALPYANSFCIDWNNKFIRPVIIRASWKRYAVSKVITAAFAGFCALLLGQLLFIISLSFKYELVNPLGGIFNSLTMGGPFTGLLLQKQYWLYFIVMVIIKSLGGVVFVIIALWLSTKITNIFVTLATPIICYNIIIYISSYFKLPGYIQMSYIYKGRIQVLGTITSFLYVLIFTVLICCIFGFLFSKGVKRRLENG